MTKATTKERNCLYAALNQLKTGQGTLLYHGHRFERAAREFEAEGLVRIEEIQMFDWSPKELRVVRSF